MINVPIDRIVPLTDARDNFSRIVADIENQKDGMYVLTKGGKPAIALININYLSEIMKGHGSQVAVDDQTKPFIKPAYKPQPAAKSFDAEPLPMPEPKAELPSFDAKVPPIVSPVNSVKPLEKPAMPVTTNLPSEIPVMKPTIDPSWITADPAKNVTPSQPKEEDKPSTPAPEKPRIANPWPILKQNDEKPVPSTSGSADNGPIITPAAPTPSIAPTTPTSSFPPVSQPPISSYGNDAKPANTAFQNDTTKTQPEVLKPVDAPTVVEPKPNIPPVTPPKPATPPPLPTMPQATIPAAPIQPPPSAPAAPVTASTIPAPISEPVKKPDLPPPPSNPVTIPFDEPPKTDSEPGEIAKPAAQAPAATSPVAPPVVPMTNTATPQVSKIQDLEI